MSENQSDTDQERLRAFEKKMHDEGTAGFADGPSPWETWDDESGLLKNKRVWEGTSKRIYPEKHPQHSFGDRVLSGLAMLSLATMVVGIAGVYFSDPQPRQVVATGIQPLPIDRTSPTTGRVIESLAQLPAPAAGNTVPAYPAIAPVRAPATATTTPAVTVASGETGLAAVEAETFTAHPPTVAAPEALTETEILTPVQQPLPEPVATTAPATAEAPATTEPVPATGTQTPTATLETGSASETATAGLETMPLPVAGSAVAPEAEDATDVAATEPAITDTIMALEALPAPTAGPAASGDTIVAIADQGNSTEVMAPAEAAEAIITTTNTGDWVVNLASYTRESTARRMLTRFRDKGVDAELVTVMINDKPMHRVRVTGFASSRTAKARIDSLEQQLGLEGVWISRK